MISFTLNTQNVCVHTYTFFFFFLNSTVLGTPEMFAFSTEQLELAYRINKEQIKLKLTNKIKVSLRMKQ